MISIDTVREFFGGVLLSI